MKQGTDVINRPQGEAVDAAHGARDLLPLIALLLQFHCAPNWQLLTDRAALPAGALLAFKWRW